MNEKNQVTVSTSVQTPSGFASVQNPPGSTSVPNPLGSTSEQNPPGSTSVPDPPGSTSVQHPPGFTSVPNPPGSTVVQNPPGSTSMQNPPGFTVVPNPPGSTLAQNPPGSTVLLTPPGSAAVQNLHGSISVQNSPSVNLVQTPSGFTITQAPPGSTAAQTPPASTAVQHSPGSTTVQNSPSATSMQTPSGFTITQTPPGFTSVQSPPGSTPMQNQAGSISMRLPICTPLQNLSGSTPLQNLPGSTSTQNLPVKRKRGRPRKDENLRRGDRPPVVTPISADPVKRNPPRIASFNGEDPLLGQEVSGFLDGSFDAGYLVTVRVGATNTTLRGVLFQPELVHPVSKANDVASNVQMVARKEIPHVQPPVKKVSEVAPMHPCSSVALNGVFIDINQVPQPSPQALRQAEIRAISSLHALAGGQMVQPSVSTCPQVVNIATNGASKGQDVDLNGSPVNGEALGKASEDDNNQSKIETSCSIESNQMRS